jgi:hypothetical protein
MSRTVYRIRGPNKTRQDAADTVNLINYNNEQKNNAHMARKPVTCQQHPLCLNDRGDVRI